MLKEVIECLAKKGIPAENLKAHAVFNRWTLVVYEIPKSAFPFVVHTFVHDYRAMENGHYHPTLAEAMVKFGELVVSNGKFAKTFEMSAA